MDSAFDRAKGRPRPRKRLNGVVDRELTADDIAMLDEVVGIKPNPLKRLRDSHHHIARLLAEKRSLAEVSSVTGYSPQRISTLRYDPLFSKLIEFYRGHLSGVLDEVYADGHKMAAALRNDVIDLLHERILETPELVSTDTAVDIFRAAADRTGMGPATKSTNLNVTLDLAGRAAAGRQRAVRLSAVGSAQAALEGSTESPGQETIPGAPDRGSGGASG